jgi:Cupin domain.
MIPMSTVDLYAETIASLDPAAGNVETAELSVSEDVLLKAFALGPGATVDPHEHEESTNVFHILEGTVVITQDNEETTVDAPGVVYNDRGVVHGARNETDTVAILTASLCPLP